MKSLSVGTKVSPIAVRGKIKIYVVYCLQNSLGDRYIIYQLICMYLYVICQLSLHSNQASLELWWCRMPVKSTVPLALTWHGLATDAQEALRDKTLRVTSL